jgi:hypothetical protein
MINPRVIAYIFFINSCSLICMAQGYRLVDVRKVSIYNVNFDDNELSVIEDKIGKPKTVNREYDKDMEIYRISYAYDSLNLEFTEINNKTFLDYIEILSPRHKLNIENEVICVGDRTEKLEKMFPLAFENYEKSTTPAKIKKDILKVYMKYDTGGEWIFYGKIVFKIKNNIINSIYVVYSAEF